MALHRHLSALDQFVLKCTEVLEKKKIRFVLISGYIVILFGRNRASEDIDMFIERFTFEQFADLWKSLTTEFDCINTSNGTDAYHEHLKGRYFFMFLKERYLYPKYRDEVPKNRT
jgi:predicted nucleotidyltransferase